MTTSAKPQPTPSDPTRSPSLSQRHSTVMSTISPFLADYLTPTDLVALLDGAVTEATLRNWRCARRGPRHITVGRRVLYSRAAIDDWWSELHATSAARWEDRA